MKILLILTFLYLTCLDCFSQQQDTVNNIKDFEQVIYNSFQHRPKIFFKLDSRNSFISSQNARMSGFKVGLDFQNTVRIGFGFNNLSTEIYKKYFLNGDPLPTFEALLRFNYISAFGEYVFYRDKRWQFTIPVQFGIGSSLYEYADPITKTPHKIDEHMILLYEPTITGHYKIFKWFGVGAGVGYRLMLINNKSIPQKFTSPVYEVGLRWFLLDFYKMVFKKEPKEKVLFNSPLKNTCS